MVRILGRFRNTRRPRGGFGATDPVSGKVIVELASDKTRDSNASISDSYVGCNSCGHSH